MTKFDVRNLIAFALEILAIKIRILEHFRESCWLHFAAINSS